MRYSCSESWVQIAWRWPSLAKSTTSWRENSYIHTFSKVISAMWFSNSFVLDLNSGYWVYFFPVIAVRLQARNRNQITETIQRRFQESLDRDWWKERLFAILIYSFPHWRTYIFVIFWNILYICVYIYIYIYIYIYMCVCVCVCVCLVISSRSHTTHTKTRKNQRWNEKTRSVCLI